MQAAKYVPGVAERRNSVDRWNHAGLSNTDSQTGSSQSLAATREYDAYGNIVNSSGTFGGPFGYAGKFGYDSGEGSLQLVGNRWYDPEVGRFLSRDPAHDGGNWYAYCANNPLKVVDPEGLRARALTSEERAAIMEAIYLLFENGEMDAASFLEKALLAGEINVDDEMDDGVYATTSVYTNVITLNGKFLARLLSRISVGRSVRGRGRRIGLIDARMAEVWLAGTLLHEYVHAGLQGIPIGIFAGRDQEREAYKREISFYERLKRKKGIWPEANQWLDTYIGGARDAMP